MLKDNEKIGAVMIVGSGIAGIQAALDLANSGMKVYLVENGISIGGVMAQLDKTFPTNDCSACILSPKLVEVGRHPNVEILTRRTVEAVSGQPGRFTVKLTKSPRFVDIDKCTGCGECANVCPVSVPAEFNETLNMRKAIYRHFPQAIPAAFAIDKIGTAPCKAACPAHISVCGFVALIGEGRYQEALKLIKKDNPFPAVCGRICNHPCERACRRRDADEAIDIMHLHRFVADLDLNEETRYIPEVKEKKDKKVAVIGAGPAGLSAAYYLAIEGYHVTVFETLAAGWSTLSFPESRLPKKIINSEIKIIEEMGVTIRTNTRVGRDISMDALHKEYDAIFIGVGSHISKKLDIPGKDLKGVAEGLDFLKRAKAGENISLGDRVAVIGSGNVAMDIFRTALATGSKEVFILYKSSGADRTAIMAAPDGSFILYKSSGAETPASVEEIPEGERIRMDLLAAPVKILGSEGKVTGIECIRMEPGKPDASGRIRPTPVKGSEFTLSVDAVISAVGQTRELVPSSEGGGTACNEWSNLEIDPVTFATGMKGVFAQDVETSPATVVKTIAVGKEAAISIVRYLRGEDITSDRKRDWTKGLAERGDISGIEKAARVEMPMLPAGAKKSPQDEAALGLSEEGAVYEAKRCLNCGICSECYRCVDVCVADAIDHDMCFEEETIEVGAVIAAPGLEVFNAPLRGEYGFGIYKNVVTSLQFERILSASGPFFGHIQRPSDGKEPEKIAFIQCVGSRDVSCGNSWCSSVCCMYATKEAVVGKEHAKNLEPTIFFMDIRAHGKDFDRFVNRAKGEYGIRYIRSMPSTIKELQQTKNLLIKYVQEDGTLVEEEFDMVVLSVGLTPPPEAAKLADSLGIELEEHGFCKTVLSNPVQTSREGVFVCGVFGGPKDIPETVMEASGAAACAEGLLAAQRGTMVIPKETPAEKDIRGIGPRIGVFVCHCGINIGGVVNVPAVVEYAKTLPSVVYATEGLFVCSQDSAVKMAEIIEEYNLTRVVVASCSPRTHEGLFEENCEKAGLNRYLFEMANIRDQNSWVHMNEPEAATQKAKDLVRMAVAKAQYLKPLKPGQLGVNHAALIIGGGLAGIIAALSLAQQGFVSYLVEKENELGGNYRHLYYTLEGLDTRKHLDDLLKQVEKNPLIHVFTGARIGKIEGFIGNYRTTIETGGGEQAFEHGVVIVATGAYELKTDEYLYGKNERVITQRELEKFIHEKDPRISGAGSVVMIQCVGSRNAERPYCSRYCCSEAVKNALKLKAADPKKDVTIIYRDIRTFGFKEDYYRKAREANVKFIRYDEDRKPEVAGDGAQISVTVFDPVLNENVEIKADILALSVGTVANPENDAIGKMLKVPTNQDGFFLEAHVKLRPVDFATDGIFMCGLAHSPKFSSEAITQANAAVSRACTILTKDYIEAEGKTAYVNKERCAACGLCEANCPFGAIAVDPNEGCAVVNTVLCKGCGICTASCRMNAVDLNGFANEEILAQLSAF